MRAGLLWVAVAGVGCGTSAGPPPDGSSPRFTTPITGAPYETVFYGAYVDHGGAEPTDYRCGFKAYPGHRGVDILLRNFLVQDSGVTVIAAAAGQVASTADGNPDRSTTRGSGGLGNHVVLDHGGGYRTYYGHLRRGSVQVAVGANVAAGAPLGLVGSSGDSNWPHLHFAVTWDLVWVDPFAGACNQGAAGLWASQLEYQDRFMVMDAGVAISGATTLAQILERPPTVGSVPATTPSVVFWAEALNIRADSFRVDVRRVGGEVAVRLERGRTTTFSTIVLGLLVPVAGSLEPGDWEMELWVKPFGENYRREYRQPITVTGTSAALVGAPRAPAAVLWLDGEPAAGYRLALPRAAASAADSARE
ncbi:MAG: peptidoglycan DD-metalloendopeptidase family protein [Gemmatimonadales bacterium]